MKLGLQTVCTMQCNLMSDVRLARDAGFDEIELQTSKMEKYFNAGFTLDDLKAAMDGIPVTMLDALYPIESEDPDIRRRLRRDCERFSTWSQALGCKAIQVVAQSNLKDYPWDEQRKKYAAYLRELADIAAPFGVNLALEPLVFSPFCTLEQALEVIDATERDNLLLSLDTFHIWTVGTPWEWLTNLNPNMFVSVHLSDTNPKQAEQWSDDDRSALPGDGIVPLNEAVPAIKATGFDGVWSVEMFSKIHWEWDPQVLVPELKRWGEAMLAYE